ncbi:LamG-like jellyroll fold domain-containing protein [Microbacterium sp. PRF11]|uniref:LamG-like jellyroll fold domain-containing protein n=1 Tax=Microbacterium sp. PRF11 TaxID=2962593 RepID=UPI002880C8D3|nr:LamG-like jellyroll fold domain-containing protein [Microbacterium sp. PRF11]MDT0117126.1 LamG-like jellyroll fold domain-containing protein [Microbacterium sp. PRF11]
MRVPRLLAATAVTAVAVSALVTTPSAVAAAVPDPGLHYTFDTLSGTLGAGAAIPDSGSRATRTDGVVGNGGITVVPGVTGAAGDKAIRLSGGRNDADAVASYVSLPNNVVTAGDTAVTVSMWTKWEGAGNGQCQLAFGLGRSTTKNLLASTSCNGTYGAVSDGAGERRVGDGGAALPVGQWANIALVFQPGQRVTYYVNGQLDGGNADQTGIAQTIDAALGQNGVGGYLGRSFWDDPFYAGAIDDVRIWNSALSADDLRAVGADGYRAVLASDSVSLGDTSSVDRDLQLPTTTAAGSTLTWATSNAGVVAADGTITRPSASAGDATATLTPTFSLGGQTRVGAPITVTVRALSANEQDEAVRQVADALPAQAGLSGDVRGSITLPASGAEIDQQFSSAQAGEVKIAWSSSNPAVVSDADRGTEPNVVREGSVTRGAQDQQVTLTATLTLGAATRTVQLPITVLKAASHTREDDEAYMFVYFRDNTIDGEKIRFAVSEGNDALNWRTLNNANPVLESTKGDMGLRDPFVLRSKEGDRFFLIATDLSAARKGFPTDTGSRYLEIWESTDLVNWGEQRHIEVSPPSAGMTWAPEAHYDPTIDAYVVYWSSRLFLDDAHTQEDGNGPQILMATTRDFVNFTPAVPYIKSGDIEGLRKTNAGLIDTTIMERDGVYYRFTKGTEETACRPDIVAEKGTDLRAPSSSGEWTKFDTCLSADAGLPETEGPSAFRSNPGDVNGDRNYVLVDWYGGGGYIPLYTESLKDGEVDWKVPAQYSLPPSPRHGVAFGITREERDRLIATYNPNDLVTSVAPVSVEAAPGTTSVSLPATVDATRPAGTIAVGVTWDEQDLSALKAPGDTVEVRGALNDGSATPAVATITAVGTPVASTSVTIGYDSRVLALGSTSALTASVAPANADQKVSWTSSNAAVASVDASGEVTAVSAGDAVITATSSDGRKALLTITVTKPEADLLLHYSFDGASATIDGSRITDVSGRGHDATIRGAGATAATGARDVAGDSAISFPGGASGSTAAFAEIGGSVVPDGTRDLTVSSWVKWDGTAACEWPLSLGSTNTNYLFTSPDCGGVAAAIKAGYTENKSGAARLQPGQWAQVTLVLTGKKTLVTYVNGQKVAEVATIFDAADLEALDGVGGLLAKSRYAQDRLFGGDLDDVRVYGRALDATEVTTLFTKGTLETEVTPSPTPTATPTSSPTPTATPTTSPEPTASPTSSPEPTVTPTSSPEPTVTPTTSPEPTASPTASPEPTTAPTGQPTSAPNPTASATSAAGVTATASASRVERGGSFTVTVTGVAPGEQLAATLNSQPLVITGIPRADARGQVTFRVNVPADFALGAHTVAIVRADGGPLATIPVQVVAAGSLAATGADLPWGLGIGALLMVAAGAALAIGRRRSRLS